MAKKRKKKTGYLPLPRIKPPPPDRRPEAAETFRGLPPFALVATANEILAALQAQGFKIRDWDERDKALQKLSIIGGKVYALAPREQPTEANTNGDGEKEPG